jgi:hypothetical protein
MLTVLIVLVIAILLLWLFNAYIPLDSRIKLVINVIAVIFIILWVLQQLGVINI